MSLCKNLATFFLLAVFILAAGPAAAAEGGGKDVLLVRLEPIVVNLMGSARRYVQVEFSLKFATPEVGDAIKTYMPVIRHKLILLLSSKNAEQLGPTEGKLKLVQESQKAINQALGLSDKNGVTEVLLGSFIIQ